MQLEHNKEDEIEIDLKDLLFELLGHWNMILMSTVMVAVIAFVISKFILIPQYQSTSALYVLSKSTSITSLADIQTGTSLTNDYIVVVTGRPVMEQVIRNLGLDETYASLSSRVSTSNPSNSRILEITVTDPDPEQAKLIADELAEVASKYISEKMDQDPPTIIQNGYADGSAVSPNIQKNTLIGALLGFFMAAAIVVISYLLNDSVLTAEDVERKLGLNLLGTLPEEEAEDDGEKKKKKKSKKPKTTTNKKTA
jgi:capsular polysaccharide biosynthesis protein